MIVPELNGFITTLGGSQLKGYNVALPAILSVFCRPVSGVLADSIGRKPIMLFGALTSIICLITYSFIDALSIYLIIRTLHGFAIGFTPGSSMAFLADIIPEKNRGEGMGIVGVFFSTGMAIGPMMGSEIANRFSYNTMFYIATATTLISAIIMTVQKETVMERKKVEWTTKMFFDKDVLPPAIIVFLTTLPFGILLTLMPDQTTATGIGNKGLFFGVYIAFSVILRFLAGRASDRYGRVNILIIGASILVVSTLMIAHIDNELMFFLSAAVFGIGVGFYAPTTFAWCVDLADPENKGRAMATFYIALELAILSGGLITNFIYKDQTENIFSTYLFGFFTSVIALIYLIFYKLKIEPKYRLIKKESSLGKQEL